MKTAVIGLGWWGKVIVKNLSKSKKINIICGVDKDITHLQDFANEYKVELRTDYESILSDSTVEYKKGPFGGYLKPASQTMDTQTGDFRTSPSKAMDSD